MVAAKVCLSIHDDILFLIDSRKILVLLSNMISSLLEGKGLVI